MRILNFGSLNIDYVYQVDHFVQPGETMSALSLQINCGGKGLNQSVALARAGAETWHAGLIGAEGRFLREALERAGVRTDLVEETAGSTGHAIIQVDRTGQNSILLHDGANGQITPAFAERVLAGFSAGDAVLVQNETSCVGEIIPRLSASCKSRLSWSGQASRFASISLISRWPRQNSDRSATFRLRRPSLPPTMQNPQPLGQPRLKKP